MRPAGYVMQPWPDTIDMTLVHCHGEVGHVVMRGVPPLPGDTVLAQMTYLNHTDDTWRRFFCSEPRVHATGTVNLLVPPCRADADAAFIALQPDRAHAMSGSNTICVVTALLESGRIPITGPETVVRLDMPAGLVIARAQCVGGRCVSVSFDNVPCFAEALDYPIETERWGRIAVDIAFGGVYYAIVDAAALGLAVEPAQARAMAQAGMALHAAIARQITLDHPTQPGLNTLSYVMFRGLEPDGTIRTATVLAPGRVDRSPCGTGSSANLATLQARGLVQVGDRRTSRSITGGTFTAELLGLTSIGTRPAILPRITGQAWVYGHTTLRIDPADPYPAGFAPSDIWGDAACRSV